MAALRKRARRRRLEKQTDRAARVGSPARNRTPGRVWEYVGAFTARVRVGADAKRLETLLLRSNRLAEVPASLADAPRLATIDVSANALTALPDALARAARLRYLDARKNPLRGFPAAAAALRTRAGNQPGCVVKLDDVVDAEGADADATPRGGKDASTSRGRPPPSSSNGGIRTGDGASDVAALREWRARSAELRELWPEFVAPTEWEGVTFDDDGRVVGVRLDKLGLVGPFPVELCRLDALRDLDLECNDLRGALPESLGRLESLRSLLLGGNAVESVPASIGRLTLLETLTLHENKLESVPSEIGTCASLRTLLLFSNALTALPDTLGRLRNLRALQLGRNRIEDAPASLAECASLEHLNLRRNRLTNVPEAWGDMRSLASLSLRGNRLESVPSSLARCPELVALDLAQNPALAVVPSEVFNLIAREGFQLTLDEGAMPMSSVGLESPPRSPVVSPPAKGSRPAVIETLSPIRDAEEEAAAGRRRREASRRGRFGSRRGRAGSRRRDPSRVEGGVEGWVCGGFRVRGFGSRAFEGGVPEGWVATGVSRETAAVQRVPDRFAGRITDRHRTRYRWHGDGHGVARVAFTERAVAVAVRIAGAASGEPNDRRGFTPMARRVARASPGVARRIAHLHVARRRVGRRRLRRGASSPRARHRRRRPRVRRDASSPRRVGPRG